jgi:membrane fusion protein, multidrug efflux system
MNKPLKPLKEVSPLEAKKTTKHGWGKRLAWFFVAALLIVAGIAWWNRQEPVRQPSGGGRNAGAVSIVPEPIGKGDIGINLNALGTVTSLATVTIRTQISGYLIKVAFTEGQEVKKGDLLAEIDPRPYEAALAQAKGNLARDEALLKGAQVDLARYQGLAAQNAVPHQTLDTQIALVSQDQGIVEADRGTVKAAEVNLQYCHIVSPLDGRVGLRQIDQGNYVTPGDASGLVVITQLQPISVLFTLPEDNLQAISKRINDGATLPAAAYDRSGANKLADGVLHTFDSQIDPSTGTIKLRALFQNDTRALYPNQFVNIRLLVDTHKDVVVMPTAGIQRGVPGTFVYLVNDDSTVSVRKVELGITDGNRVEVRSGLAVGDRIVVDGADKLRDGAKINIRAAADANSPPRSNPGSTGGPDPSGGKKRRSEGGPKQ